jgi:glycine oxidase
MAKTFDIALIGGGIIGLLTAREFSKIGATVVLVDKGQAGQESSWAGGGILLPLYPWRQDPAISELVLASLPLYPVLAEELLENTGIDPEWNPCGLLITQNPDFGHAIEWCNGNEIKHEQASPARLAGLGGTIVHPLWLPDIAQIRNPRLVKALKQDLLQRGVTFIENCHITDVESGNNRIHSIATNYGKLAMGQLILATGAWTAEFMRQFFPMLGQITPNISPVKGEMLLFAAKAGLLRSIVLACDQYLIPRLDGHILAGSTVEHNTFDRTTTEDAKATLCAFAYELLPALKHCPLAKQWSGIRPGTVKGIPYIGKHPEILNLSINAGHFRNGFAMAPASAKLMVDLILNRPTSVDPKPYQLCGFN